MKYRIKIPEDLKMKDILLCDNISVANSMNGHEFDMTYHGNKAPWAIIDGNNGVDLRIPSAWLEEIKEQSNEWLDEEYRSQELFNRGDMINAFNSGVKSVNHIKLGVMA